MAIDGAGSWVTVSTDNSEDWVDQSYTLCYSTIISVRLCKKLANTGCENGLEIKTEKDRFWMRYMDFNKCEEDYKALVALLVAIGG